MKRAVQYILPREYMSNKRNYFIVTKSFHVWPAHISYVHDKAHGGALHILNHSSTEHYFIPVSTAEHQDLQPQPRAACNYLTLN